MGGFKAMAYMTGKSLERKIRQYGLVELDSAISSLASGGEWIGDQGLSTEPANLEMLRTVIYSILHKHGVKEMFKVRMRIAASMIELRLQTPKDLAVNGFKLDPLCVVSRQVEIEEVENPVDLRETIFADEAEEIKNFTKEK